VQPNTTYPYWAEAPLKAIKASELLNNLSFEIWNSNTFIDDYMGGCALPMQAELFDGSLQAHLCPATASTDEVTLWFRIQPHP
jgi:hypothetical protein